MPPKVSVNIVCYNHDKYIGRAIQSVLDQTFTDFELIICNNGSTDKSLEIINSFKDSRIKVKSIYPNKQSTFAGNECINMGCGEYVALLCSDDAWEPTKLEKQIEYMENNKRIGVTFTRVQTILPDGRFENSKNNIYNIQFNKYSDRTSLQWLNYMWKNANHCFCCSSACIRRKCFEELGSFDIRTKYIQDFILWTDILIKYDVYVIDEKLTQMRYFPKKDNLSAKSANTIIASLNEMQILYEKFKKINTIDKFLKFLPETKDQFNYINEKYIPFYLAIMTLKNYANSNFKSAALTHLYEIMADDNMRKSLEKDYGFSFMDLYNTATETDIYREKELRKCLNYMSVKKYFTILKIFFTNIF